MKRFLSLLCSIVILLCGLLLTGCAPKGTSMIPLSNVQGSFFDDYTGTKDAYLCRIRDNSPADLSIPGEYNGKPVVAIETDAGLKNLDSLEIGDGVLILKEVLQYMDHAPQSITLPASVEIIDRSFSDCPDLKTVVIEGSLKRLDACFTNCPDLESVEIRGSVDLIDNTSFSHCPSLKKITINGDVKQIHNYAFCNLASLSELSVTGDVANVGFEKYIDNKVFTDCPMLTDLHYGSNSDGSIDKVKAELSTPTEDIKEKAMQKLGTAFDKNKEISVSEAPQYADVLNGPVLGMTVCADCSYKEYAVDKVPQNVDLRINDTQYIDDAFPETVVTAEKAAKISSGDADVVYALVERIGYSDGPEYVMGPSGYFMHFRVSLWNSRTDELIAWYTERVGDAPFSYKAGEEQIFFDYPTGDSSRNYHKDENKKEPTPLSIIEKDFYNTVNTEAY